MADPSYPVFLDPEQYTKLRVSGMAVGRLKQRAEHQALDGCFSMTRDVKSVCDVPCGPGRLFHYWQRKNLRVTGRDFSQPMAEAAKRLHAEMRLEGDVTTGDAFYLQAGLTQVPDMVASVRFVYYFESADRVRLLRSLGAASRRYVLFQFKTTETYRGHRNDVRVRIENRGKHHCSTAQMLQEVREAGLTPLRVQPIGELSDRVFVLAEKPKPGEAPVVHISPAPGRLIGSLLRLVRPPAAPQAEPSTPRREA